MPGRQSRALLPKDIARLKQVQRRMYEQGKGGSVPTLKLAMEAPFKWGVLQRALDGERIWILNYNFIVEWLDAHCPEEQMPIDRKAAASGEREEGAAADELVSRDGD